MTLIIDELKDLLGQESVLEDEASRVLYSQDVLGKGEVAVAIIRPSTTAELAASVAKATQNGAPVLARGGGMSYTSGYVPPREGCVVIDMSRMNRVLEVNLDDLYVTVEAGCTWESLHKALEGTGFRTPFWGTLSGRFATVGGGMSQNCIFWGSGTFGPAVESVIAMTVVLADGSVVSTGSSVHAKSNPFYRHFGPDLTGIFLSDCGALGFKATVTLKLIPEYGVRRGLSFAADKGEDLVAFAADVQREQLASEVCGFDPLLQGQRLQRESLAKDVKALAGVMKAAGGIRAAIKEGAKVALAGRGYMKDVAFSIHALVEEREEGSADYKIQRIRELANKYSLRELENSIPKILRANPFGPVNNMIGARGERWAPVHGVLPLSRAVAAYQAVEALFARHEPTLEKHGVGCGYLFSTVAPNGFVLEPLFFWPDELNELHKHAVEADHLKRLKGFSADPEAREAVMAIREELIHTLADHGAMHMQLGRSYPLDKHYDLAAWKLLSTIKRELDPNNLINPGVLGLDKAYL